MNGIPRKYDSSNYFHLKDRNLQLFILYLDILFPKLFVFYKFKKDISDSGKFLLASSCYTCSCEKVHFR